MKTLKKLNRLMAVILTVSMMFSAFTITTFTASAAETDSKVAGEFYTSGDFDCKILDDGTAEIAKYVGTVSELTIPSELGGYTVTSIGANAFHYRHYDECLQLESVIIPESVTKIGRYAFWGCSDLINITISDNIVSVGKDAFWGTAWYDNQPEGLLYIGDVVYEYKGEMPENTSVTLKEGAEVISEFAFRYCDSLTSITIPDSVTSINDFAFYECSNLTDINVEKNNNEYFSVNGVLFDKNNEVLICYPKGKVDENYTIPNGIKNIEMYAFNGCESLTSVTIPDSVTSIGEGAFEYCSNLESVKIPKNVASIDNYAFEDCSSLTSITIQNGVKKLGMVRSAIVHALQA